jgi:hypothetical protein
MAEDPTFNRMSDALTLFQNICANKVLINTGMILFLNMKDLFLKKIKKSPIEKFFPDYKGNRTLKRFGRKFIPGKYIFSTEIYQCSGNKGSNFSRSFHMLHGYK